MSDWKKLNPALALPAGTCPVIPPGPDKVREICLFLDPARTLRYQPRDGKTYCNIFVSDVCDIWGVPPAHTIDGRELNANATVAWLRSEGPAHGWIASDRRAALDAANRGHLVIVGWHSGQSSPGHVGIALADGNLAQAGRVNFVGKSISQGFGNRTIEFFVQMRGATHDAV